MNFPKGKTNGKAAESDGIEEAQEAHRGVDSVDPRDTSEEGEAGQQP
jgi:hypothetical protein